MKVIKYSICAPLLISSLITYAMSELHGQTLDIKKAQKLDNISYVIGQFNGMRSLLRCNDNPQYKDQILQSFRKIAETVNLNNIDQRIVIGDDMAILHMLDRIEHIRNTYKKPDDIYDQLKQWAREDY